MGCPRIILLNVTTVTFIVIALCTHTYMYTCPPPFGADGLINKINLFNSTGVTESYIANSLFVPYIKKAHGHPHTRAELVLNK